MKKLIVISGLLGILLVTSGCSQFAARNFGGTTIETLPVNTKLVNATWKEHSLWYLTRPMKQGETADSYEFKESSVFGALEGKVIINEVKGGQ